VHPLIAGIFGIFARNLVARSGSKSDSFTLLDERGCPTDPVIFPALEKVAPNSKSLVAPFEAFKFTADSVVRFQVNIQFCLPECLPVITITSIQFKSLLKYCGKVIIDVVGKKMTLIIKVDYYTGDL
jgi:hypothetical protein